MNTGHRKFSNPSSALDVFLQAIDIVENHFGISHDEIPPIFVEAIMSSSSQTDDDDPLEAVVQKHVSNEYIHLGFFLLAISSFGAFAASQQASSEHPLCKSKMIFDHIDSGNVY